MLVIDCSHVTENSFNGKISGRRVMLIVLLATTTAAAAVVVIVFLGVIKIISQYYYC